MPNIGNSLGDMKKSGGQKELNWYIGCVSWSKPEVSGVDLAV